MPDRRGKTMKKRQNREQHRQEPEFEDKGNKDWMSPVEWSPDDYDEDDIDQSSSDDYYAINNPKTKKNRNRRQNIVVQSSVVPIKYPSQSSNTQLNEYNDEQYLNDRQVPSQIFKIFSKVEHKEEVMKILKGIQDEEDRYCQSKDEKVCSRQQVIEYFQQIKYVDFEQENRKQILKYLQKPILRNSQHGVLLFNSERQNYDGMWNAPMGYRKIDDNYQLETIMETVSRGFNEQIHAKHQLTDEIFECYDLQDNHQLDSYKYIKKHINIENEFVGLFISQFDDPIIEFELHNTYKNQDDRNQILDKTFATILVTNYVPKILADFNLRLRLPKSHMNIPQYKKCIFERPRIPNSLRKIAMNNENYVIGVKRIGSTLFLRRHDKRLINKNDVGFRFEQMCRPNYHLDAEYKLLVEGCFGNLRTLITAEADAVCKPHRTMEFKSRLDSNHINQPANCGVSTVIVGHRTNDEPPRLVDILLCFLRENVKQDGIYLLSRRYDSRVGKRDLYLYKVADKDKQELTFVTTELLNQLGFNL
ncbi:hypothetical protein I4U23_004922 [Adineta vaga]|nr:hypothetical protein I4U23_004922 [Adineta vaga]